MSPPHLPPTHADPRQPNPRQLPPAPSPLVPPHRYHPRVYNADFFAFAKDLLATCANGPEVPGLPVGSTKYGELIRWGTWVAVELAARASDNDDLDAIVDALCMMYAKVRARNENTARRIE